MDICVVGDAFMDIVAAGMEGPPKFGENVDCAFFALQTGGSAGNVASHVVGLSPAYRCKYIAGVGSEKDDFARLFVSQLSARGVDCSLMQRYERVPMGSCAVLSTSKDRAFVSCLGTNHHLAVDALKQPSVFPFLHSCHHLHISGYFSLPLLQCTAMTELCRELRSSEKGLTISLDTQDDGPNSWLGRGGHLRELLGEIDLFMPNENEAVRIATALRNASSSSTSSSASSSAASSSSSSALCTIPESVSILTDVLPRGALLVLKLGEKGAAVFRDGKMLAAHAAFQVKVVDTTGGGDAFDAGFICEWVRTRSNPVRSSPGTSATASVPEAKKELDSLKRSLRLACAAGAYRVTLVGGSSNCPSRELLETFIARHDTYPESVSAHALFSSASQAQLKAKL